MAALTELAIFFGHIASTTLKGASKAILAKIVALDSIDGDAEQETATDEPTYGPIGFYSRPMPPVTKAQATGLNPEGSPEIVGVRLGDHAVPIVGRDLRLNAKMNPKDGEVGLVQYQGGFVALMPNTSGNGTNIMLYAVRNTPAGVPDKASCISIDSESGNQQITLMHEYGQSITLTKDGDIMLVAKNGSNWIQVSQSQGVVISGDKLALAGGCMLGDKDPATGEFVMLSTQLLLWITQVNAVCTTLFGAVGLVVPAITVPTAAPVAATLVKAK